MRWVFDEIFAELWTFNRGAVAVTAASISWPGMPGVAATSASTCMPTVRQSADAIGEFSSAAQAQAFLRFCAKTKEVYGRLEQPYMRAAKPNLRRMIRGLGIGGLTSLGGLGPFANYWQVLGRYFE